MEQNNTVAKKSGGKILVKIGIAMLLVSGVLTASFYSVLQAQSIPYNPQDHKLSSQERNVTAQVVKVEISGPIDLTLEQNANPSMKITGEQHLLDNLNAVVDGDTLKISSKGVKLHGRHTINVNLSLPALQSLRMHGSGDTNAKGFTGDNLTVALRGSGDLRFDGQYKNITAQLDGSGDLNLHGGKSEQVTLELTGSGDLTATGEAKTVQTKLHGSGDMRAASLIGETVVTETVGSGDTQVHAKQSIKVDLRGNGEVNIAGNPSSRSVSTKGNGEVNFN